MNTDLQQFAPRLIDWQRRHGRHGLPWQGQRDPYRVWLSEVMLQQTQVSTVLAYYGRFLARFADVQALAAAPLDDVLSLWSGLGYYSRARNLHRCAQVVCEQHGGVFPASSRELERLPGIGASTAAAIAAFCHGERISILDGNVRRVLSRLLAFDQDLAQLPAQRALWALAQDLLPPAPSPDDMVAYTQGLMDLGASLCGRHEAQCLLCPVASLCQGRRQGDPLRFPVRSRKLLRRHETWPLLVMQAGAGVWLERRPPTGIWAGLWSPPVFGTTDELLRTLGPQAAAVREDESVSHSLTHRELRLLPFRVVVDRDWPQALGLSGQWFDPPDWAAAGLPAPIRKYLTALGA